MISQARDAGDERLGVGVDRVSQDLFRLPILHDLATVHDGNVTSQPFDDGKIMSDEKDGHPKVALEFTKLVEDLLLDCDIKGRGRLIRYQEIGAC